MAEKTRSEAVETGDYIIGESAVYEVAEINDGQYNIAVAEVVAGGEIANTGWQSENAVESLGAHVPRRAVEDLSVSDGDTITWHDADRQGTDATATVHIRDDGTVELESDGLFVPGRFNSILELKVNIVLGHASQ